MVGYRAHTVETVVRVVRIETDYVFEKVTEGIEYQVVTVGMPVFSLGRPFAELRTVAVCFRLAIDLFYDFIIRFAYYAAEFGLDFHRHIPPHIIA